MNLTICPNCGGVKGCNMFGGCSQHYHCDCGILRINGSLSNKQLFERRNKK